MNDPSPTDTDRRTAILDAAVESFGKLGYYGTSLQRIATMVADLVSTSARRGDIAMSEPVWEAMMELRSWLFENVYTQSDAKVEEPKANGLVERLFMHYIGHLDEVPAEYRLHDSDAPEVQVADYISGMTDRYAIRDYERLFLPRAWRR